MTAALDRSSGSLQSLWSFSDKMYDQAPIVSTSNWSRSLSWACCNLFGEGKPANQLVSQINFCTKLVHPQHGILLSGCFQWPIDYRLISSSHEPRPASYEHVRGCEQGLACSSCTCNPSVSHFLSVPWYSPRADKSSAPWEDGTEGKPEKKAWLHSIFLILVVGMALICQVHVSMYMLWCTLCLRHQCHLFVDLFLPFFDSWLHFVNWSLHIFASFGFFRSELGWLQATKLALSQGCSLQPSSPGFGQNPVIIHSEDFQVYFSMGVDIKKLL